MLQHGSDHYLSIFLPGLGRQARFGVDSPTKHGIVDKRAYQDVLLLKSGLDVRQASTNLPETHVSIQVL